MYEYRPLRPRQRATAWWKLAEALGPAYIRVWTWANTTYFQDGPGPGPKTPPSGFGGVLTQRQWKGVVGFSKAANAELVASVAISPGARDTLGNWTPVEAAKVWVRSRHSIGGNIAATEFMNEPNAASMGGTQRLQRRRLRERCDRLQDVPCRSIPKRSCSGPGSVGRAV